MNIWKYEGVCYLLYVHRNLGEQLNHRHIICTPLIEFIYSQLGNVIIKTDPDETRPYNDENFKFDPKYNSFTISKILDFKLDLFKNFMIFSSLSKN